MLLFLQPIFVSIPLPCLPGKASSANIRLLCSVTGSTEKATWQDVTGSTPLELCKDVVHFSTKVSGTFWLLVIHDKQREPDSALTLANRCGAACQRKQDYDVFGNLVVRC